MAVKKNKKRIVYEIKAEIDFTMEEDIEIENILEELRCQGKAEVINVRIEEEKE
jgi:hypothetical protein